MGTPIFGRYLTVAPFWSSGAGATIAGPWPSSLARTIPWLSTPRSVFGARLHHDDDLPIHQLFGVYLPAIPATTWRFSAADVDLEHQQLVGLRYTLG